MINRIFLVLMLVGGYAYLAPYLVTKRLLDATKEYNGVLIAEYVDFEAVRASIRSQLDPHLFKSMPRGLQNFIYYMIQAEYRHKSVQVSDMIDIAITPKALIAFMKRMEEAQHDPTTKVPEQLLSKIDAHWSGLGKFMITITYRRSVLLVLEPKHLIFWRLTKVILPIHAYPSKMRI